MHFRITSSISPPVAVPLGRRLLYQVTRVTSSSWRARVVNVTASAKARPAKRPIPLNPSIISYLLVAAAYRHQLQWGIVARQARAVIPNPYPAFRRIDYNLDSYFSAEVAIPAIRVCRILDVFAIDRQRVVVHGGRYEAKYPCPDH